MFYVCALKAVACYAPKFGRRKIVTRKIEFSAENAMWMLRAEMPKHCWKNAGICNKLQKIANVENCTADKPWSYNTKQAEVVSEPSFYGEKLGFDRKARSWNGCVG